MAAPMGDFFGAPAFAFLTGFTVDPTAGRQMTAYNICMTARGIKLSRSVGTGSSTKAGNRKQNTEKRSAGWMLVKSAARLVGSSSIGDDGFKVITCGAAPDIVTGSISGIMGDVGEDMSSCTKLELFDVADSRMNIHPKNYQGVFVCERDLLRNGVEWFDSNWESFSNAS